jgi:hypothetical protein
MKNKHLANVVLVCVTTFFGVACTENFEEPKLDLQDNVLKVVDGTLIDRFFS